MCRSASSRSLIGWWKLPAVPGHDVRRPDAWARALVTFGIGALTFGIVQDQRLGLDFARRRHQPCARGRCCSALFVATACARDNPFVDPALFRIRPFTGAALIMAPYSAAFGAMLLSLALWVQTGWGWSALKTGIAIAPGRSWCR